MIFLNSASSAAALVFYLPGVCSHTDTEGKQRNARVRNILKSSEKNTIFNEHPVSNNYISRYYTYVVSICVRNNKILSIIIIWTCILKHIAVDDAEENGWRNRRDCPAQALRTQLEGKFINGSGNEHYWIDNQTYNHVQLID